MREINKKELELISGGTGVCTPENSIGGVGDPIVGSDLSYVYDALVAATSRLIERIANAY